jgi:tRNA threonylcarbamoyladenosine biosynthesis protein TsaE
VSSENALVIETDSPEETFSFGKRLAERLAPGSVVGLIGDLGSGKTCLIQGICAGLDVDEAVVSPTFTLINEYEGRAKVAHFDLYRLNDAEGLLDLGFDEYIDSRRVCLVEWADKFPELMPPESVMIHLDTLNGDGRRIRVRFGAPDGVSGG